MNGNNFKYWIVFVLFLTTYFANGQGCSDAGFCTINSFKPDNSDSIPETKNQFKIGTSLGDADHSILVVGNYLEYNRQINDKVGIDVKLTSLIQQGNNISVFGLSDVYVNTNYKLNEKLKLTLGAKIPLSNANRKKNDLPLPMDYQASLGTFDFIVGIGYKVKEIQFVAAWQQPITQNGNQFVAENYPDNSELINFQSTNKFKRSGDVLLRISYPIKLSKKFSITPSLLPIYHLTQDKYTDSLNTERKIEGSNGLTLNGNAYFDFEINKNNILQLNFGKPFIFREARPDGLTRSFIVTLEYRFKF